MINVAKKPISKRAIIYKKGIAELRGEINKFREDKKVKLEALLEERNNQSIGVRTRAIILLEQLFFWHTEFESFDAVLKMAEGIIVNESVIPENVYEIVEDRIRLKVKEYTGMQREVERDIEKAIMNHVDDFSDETKHDITKLTDEYIVFFKELEAKLFFLARMHIMS